MAVSRCNTTRIKVSAPSSCFTPNYPSDCVFICLSVRTSVCVELRCFMTLHTSRSRFTFYTHILSAGQQLSVSVFAVQFHYPLTD